MTVEMAIASSSNLLSLFPTKLIGHWANRTLY